MRSILVSYFNVIYDFFKIPMQIYEFSFSLWDVLLFTVFSSIIFWFIGRMLDV